VHKKVMIELTKDASGTPLPTFSVLLSARAAGR